MEKVRWDGSGGAARIFDPMWGVSFNDKKLIQIVV